jgi:hypothetical protein
MRALLLLLLLTGAAGARNPHGGVGPFQITSSSLPAASQFATSYSQTLTASGGHSPYTWNLISQSGYNPSTWQLSSSGVLTNAMPMLLNVETANLQVQVTDSTLSSVSTTLPITVTRTVPAGAAALGYHTVLWCNRPTTGNIYFGAYGTSTGLPWSSGQPFYGTIPPSSLYSMNSSGVLGMTQTPGTVNAGPASYMPDMVSVQLSNGSNVPIAAGLAVIPAGNGYDLSGIIQISVADPNIRPALYTFPTQHNVANTQDIDPNDGNNHRWLEKDTWEGRGANGKTTADAWNGNLPWSNVCNACASNTAVPGQDITLQHMYETAWAPSTGTAYRYLDNVANGSMVASSATGVPLTTEQLAFVNSTTDYVTVSAFNDGTTAFTMYVGEICVYIPP